MVTGEGELFRQKRREYLAKEAFSLRIQMVNNAFRNSEHARDHRETLSSLPNPIAVDYNGVLADHRSYSINPLAPKLLSALQDIGSVVIVTASMKKWEYIQQRLEDENLWNDTLLLMGGISWIGFGYKTPKEEALVENYTTQMREQGYNYTAASFFNQDLLAKRIGPYFNKPEIPLIDDNPEVFQSNHGVMPLLVPDWTSGIKNHILEEAYTRAIQKVKERYHQT